jgi:hypothetical protein
MCRYLFFHFEHHRFICVFLSLCRNRVHMLKLKNINGNMFSLKTSSCNVFGITQKHELYGNFH